MNDSRFWLTEPDFFPGADELRSEFNERFAEPREASEQRFVWDYWHIPNQYTLVRTPAYHFFNEELWEELSNHLIAWGQENLGCQDISPAWLSYYVEGCGQELHADIPHGPWAFVFSLTDWEARNFSGGETMIVKPGVLNYWKGFDYEKGLEYNDMVQHIEPKFNQLTVFDPRLPHGVREVRGSKNPIKSRLVIHGWFTNPSPFITGGLEQSFDEESLDQLLEPLHEPLAEFQDWTGNFIVKVKIGADGKVREQQILTNTLVSSTGADERLAYLEKQVKEHFNNQNFAASEEETLLTIPFFF